MMIIMMIFGLLITLVFIAAVVIGIIYLVRYMGPAGMAMGAKPPSAQDALEIAKQRYARGEISKEEFEQLKRDLM